MRRRPAGLVAVLAAVGCAGLGVPAGAGAHRYPARLLVYAQEFSLSPSRPALPAGAVVVQLYNRGQDAHDLRARRLRGGAMVGRTWAIGVTRPGAVRSATWRLSPGRWELYCSMPGHLAAGMHVVISVRRG